MKTKKCNFCGLLSLVNVRMALRRIENVPSSKAHWRSSFNGEKRVIESIKGTNVQKAESRKERSDLAS